MQKMLYETKVLLKDGSAFSGPITVGFVGIRETAFDPRPYAIVMVDPDDEVCRELFGYRESFPYIDVPLKELRPTPEEFNRIFRS